DHSEPSRSHATASDFEEPATWLKPSVETCVTDGDLTSIAYRAAAVDTSTWPSLQARESPPGDGAPSWSNVPICLRFCPSGSLTSTPVALTNATWAASADQTGSPATAVLQGLSVARCTSTRWTVPAASVYRRRPPDGANDA